MNVGPAWQKGYTGKGVVVSILDDGIQRNHPDLDKNYVSFISARNVSTPKKSEKEKKLWQIFW